MRVLIVDDEAAARRRLAALLAALDVEVAGVASDGVMALDEIRARKPDVVLLDIAMPEADGFEVARHLPDPRPLVIFQTAYGDHALKAFDHEAVDYVVKPITLARLRQAIDRAGRRLLERSAAATTPAVLARIEAAVAQSRPVRRTRVLVRQGAGHRALALRDVIRFSADEGLVYALTAAGRHLTDYTLNELESRLAGIFIRTNRADLVHLDRIERLASNGDGSATLTLAAGTVVHVSRRRAAAVRRSLQS
jgi:DNA-binding LytR/AlgR family response regulator